MNDYESTSPHESLPAGPQRARRQGRPLLEVQAALRRLPRQRPCQTRRPR
jgi:hypothetical protein